MAQHALTAERISLTVADRPILKEISLSLHPASITVLAGPVGSGKTVLSRILSRLLRADSGTVETFGKRVGIVLQDARAHLLGSTVEEDLRIGPAAARQTRTRQNDLVDRAISTCGIDRLRSRSIHTLSGGEARLTALASALTLEPAVLICDEPFANLDWSGVDRVLRALITASASGCAVMVVTHELEKVLAHATHLYVLHEGTLALSVPLPAGLSAEIRSTVARFGIRMVEPLERMSWLIDDPEHTDR